MKKIIISIIVVLLVVGVVVFTCVMKNNSKTSLAEERVKIGYYTYEKENIAWGWVQIKENNEFSFSRGVVLSYIPEGKYEIKDDTLILTAHNGVEKYEFKISEDKLTYICGDTEVVEKGTVFTYQGKELKD